MTAIVLAGGRGRRLQRSDHSVLAHEAQRRAAVTGLKVLMPVDAAGTRVLLDHVLSRLADAGCTNVVLVVPPEHEDLRRHLDRYPPVRVRCRLAVQPDANGTAGALAAAAPLVDDAHFLVVNGDNLYPVTAVRDLIAIEGCGLAAFARETLTASGFSTARVAAFATVQHEAAGWLTGVTEKPSADAVEQAGPRALVSMNLWKASPALFDACRDVPRSPRGERELPDAVMLAVRRGVPFRVIEGTGAVLDVTTAADLASVTRALAGVEPRP